MGKKGGANKGKKVNSVFKVAGARSLKMKNKAKPVAAQLKKVIDRFTSWENIRNIKVLLMYLP